MEYVLMYCTRDKKQGPKRAGHFLLACVAAILLLVTVYRVGSLQHMHQPLSPSTFLATGSISSCSMPEAPSSAALTSVVATVDIDCSFRVGQTPSSRRSVLPRIGSQQSSSNKVPQVIEVSSLDTLTCAMIKATAGSSTVSSDMMLGQQQYVFLLQPTATQGLEPGAPGASFQVIEYAPLADINQEESLAFLVSEWSHLVPGGITPLGCNKPSLVARLGKTRAEGEVIGSSWGADSFQSRRLLQNADGSPAASPVPSTPVSISLVPINLTDYAADQPAAAPTNSSGFANQTTAHKPTASAPKTGGSSNKTAAASNLSKPSTNSTAMSSNSTATTNSSSGIDTSGETVEAAAGPTDVQQQQALSAILSGNSQSDATMNGTSTVDKTAACMSPAATGPCRASIPRWAYDATKKSCIEFVWGGCQGNENRFETMQACHDACARVDSSALPGAMNGSTILQGTVNGSTVMQGIVQPQAPAAPIDVSTTPLGVPAIPAAVSPAIAAPIQAPAPPVYSIPTAGMPDQVIIKAPAPVAHSASALPVMTKQLLSAVGVLVVCQLWLL